MLRKLLMIYQSTTNLLPLWFSLYPLVPTARFLTLGPALSRQAEPLPTFGHSMAPDLPPTIALHRPYL